MSSRDGFFGSGGGGMTIILFVNIKPDLKIRLIETT